MFVKIRNYLIIASMLLVFFMIFSILPGAIHSDHVSIHVEESEIYMKDEGLYPSIFKSNLAFLDNWTDSVLINIIYCQNDISFKSGISNLMVSPEQGETVIDALDSAINGIEANYAYSNFWLGCKLPIKLMLCFFNIGQIRYILYVINMIFCLYVILVLQKYIDGKIAIAYFVTMVLFATFFNVVSLSASFDLLSLHVELLLLLLLLEKGKKRSITYFFFVFGAMCSFYQCIYIPAVLPGMLSIVCMLYEDKYKQEDLQKENYHNLFLRAIAWIGGYVFTSISKQIICLLFLENEIGMDKMKQWGVSSLKERLLAIVPPLKSLMIPEMLCVGLFFILILFILLIANVIELDFSIKIFKKNIVVILISLLFPVIWFFILPKATSHGWYCQNFIPVIFTIIYSITKNFKFNL